MQVPEDLLLFKIPSDYRPGDDKLSKIVLSSPTIIDQIMKYLLDVAPGAYISDNTEWSNGMRSDVLYVPRLSISCDFPPVLIEVQKLVDQNFMARLITYSINVFMRYKVHPIVLVFCVDKVCQAVMGTFEQSKTKVNMFETTCYHWAKNCYLISNKIINPALNNKSSDNMDPIVAMQYFLGSQQRSIMALDFYDDPTIIELYKVAKIETEKYVEASNSQLNALSTICSTSESQFNKIKELLKDEIPENSKVFKYINQGAQYHSRLKKKYEEAIYGLNDEDGALTPMQDPEEIKNAEPLVQKWLSNQEVAFVKDFIVNRSGRMSWKACLEAGREMGYFKKYGTSESLRVTYACMKRGVAKK
ncbi:hypothetical protein RMATCC62417_14494 [Rhizopus microsporus]|nr:hypothetical protein RMATCC62417_14494 [Rhizopus microsporus]